MTEQIQKRIKRLVDGDSFNIKPTFNLRRKKMAEIKGKKTTKILKSLDIKPALRARTESKEAANIKPALQAREEPKNNNKKDE